MSTSTEGSAESATVEVERRGWRQTLLLVAVLALAFQGSRGLWEPDEGFYSNVALGMLHSGDWLIPRLNGEVFLDKPPLVYWSMAGGMAVLGETEWGVRLGHALAFFLTAFLVGDLGRRMWGAAAGRAAALVYATSLLPFLAANVGTPDTLLTACVAATYYCYWRAEHHDNARRRDLWWLAMGLAIGLGLLAKGPAMLIVLPPILLHIVLRRRLLAVLRTPGVYLGALLALALGASWYVLVVARLPGAGAYILDNQIVGRLATSRYLRNPGWRGAWRVYPPTLIAGAFPWSAVWLVGLVRWLRGGRKITESLAPLRSDAPLLMALWIAFPFLVLTVAQSRLPLYLLPIWPPLALATGRWLSGATPGNGLRPWPLHRSSAVVAWCLFLLATKVAVALWPASSDTRQFAAALTARVGPGDYKVVACNIKRNAMPFYGYTDLEWITTSRDPYPFFTPPESLAHEVGDFAVRKKPTIYLVSSNNLDTVRDALVRVGGVCAVEELPPSPPALLCRPPV